MVRFLLSGLFGFVLAVVLVVITALPVEAKLKELNLEDFIFLDTKYGRSIILLYPDKAPNHVARVRKLVREGFYDGLKFHRVLHGFMAQTGDPRGDGTGGSQYPDLRAEINGMPFNRGVIGAARAMNPHSANSQFFICFQAAWHLNPEYTAWGKVVKGMEYIDKIKRGSEANNGTVVDPDVIISMKVAADVPGDHRALLLPLMPGAEAQQRKKILPRIP